MAVHAPRPKGKCSPCKCNLNIDVRLQWLVEEIQVPDQRQLVQPTSRTRDTLMTQELIMTGKVNSCDYSSLSHKSNLSFLSFLPPSEPEDVEGKTVK